MDDTRDHALSILYVDDEPGLLEIGKIYLEKNPDFSIITVGGAVQAIKILSDRHFDAIISDYQMPGMDGIAFLKHLRSAGDTTPFIIFTGKGREDVVIQALNEGADFYLQKGGEPKAQFAELSNKVRYAINRRRSEEALRESEDRYKNVVETQSEFICRFLPDGTHIFANEAYCRRFNKRTEELIGNRFKPVIHPDDSEKVARFFASLTPDHPIGTIEQRIILPDGMIVWHRINTQSFFNDDGTVHEYQSVGQDITELVERDRELQKKNEELSAAEEELRAQLEEIINTRDLLTESNEYLGNLITYANAPIIVWDTDLLITKFNDAFGRLTGIPPEQAIGSHIEVLFPEERREESMELIRRAMAGEMWDVVEIPILNRSGQVRTVLWNSANIRESDGKTIIATIAQGQDITDRKHTELAILQKNEELHAAYEQLTASEEKLKENIEELTRHEQFIRESELRLRYLLGFYERANLPEKELLAYALEGECEITGSRLGYLAFLNDNETELSMYAWSETAMKECSIQEKPIVYSVEKTGLWGEAVRQCRPVITNDYAAPSPVKKGYPDGHPQIIRHMNVPILDGDQIVIVAGVANKPLDYTDNDTSQLTLLMQGLWQILIRRRIEKEIRSHQEQLTEITEMVPGVVFQFYTRPDGEKELYYISSRAEEVFGISSSAEEFFERFTERVDPLDHNAFLKSIEDAAKSGLPWHYEGRFIRPSGEEIWFQGMSRPIQRGNELLFNGILLDTTYRKKTEESLQERIKELSCLYSISDIIEESDRPYDEVMQTIAEMIPYGFQHPEKTTASIRINEKEHTTPGYQSTPWKIHADILIHEEPIGSITICLMECDQILLEEEKLVESISLQIGRYIERIRVIGELQQKNTALKAAREAFHRANKKLQLLSSITRHDILNKIMALEGFLNFAEERSVDFEQSGHLNEVRKIIGAIQRQIEFTRMYEDVGLKKPLWQPLWSVIATLHDEHVQVHDNCTEISIYADPMLEKVFYNLHENTIRYAKGARQIGISCEEREGKLTIICEDDGPGIPDDLKEQIFDQGYGKNTGFGLFLAREILAITGITIQETGTYGKGARFEIVVPDGAWQRI